MQVSIELPRPTLGRKVYVPSGDNYVGGLATIVAIVGSAVVMDGLPNVSFEWEHLVKNQARYVQLYGGSKARRTIRRTA